MKKIFITLMSLCLCTGCSCSPGGSQPSNTSTPTASSEPSPSPSSETLMGQTQDYIEYLSDKYSLVNTKMIENLDTNAIEGYTFGLNNENYYLVRFDPANEQATRWLSELNSTGQIETDIDGLTRTMYGLVNGNYALLSETGTWADGFQEYYNAFSQSQSLPGTNPTPSALSEAKE